MAEAPALDPAAASVAAEAAPPGSLRHLVWLYSAPEERARLAALLAIEHEVMTSTRAGLDHQVAHARLAWWQEECERLAAALPRHPDTRRLLSETRRAGEPAPDLSPLVAAAAWDLAGAVAERRAELDRRCANWSAGLFRHLAPASAGWLAGTGAIVEELALLARLPADARRGRLRVPLEELAALGLGPEALEQAPVPAALGQWLGQRHARLCAALAQALEALEPAARPRQRSAFVWAALAARDSARSLRALRPDGVAAGRLDGLRDAWTAWRAARRALTQRVPRIVPASFT